MQAQDRRLLRKRISECKAIAWDTCHKIYVLMDDSEVQKMKEYGYTSLIEIKDLESHFMYSVALKWYKESCGLKFIEAVFAGDKFETIVPQGGR